MSVHKRNGFLENSDSEDDVIDRGYTADAIEESRNAAATSTRPSKRQKIDQSAYRSASLRSLPILHEKETIYENTKRASALEFRKSTAVKDSRSEAYDNNDKLEPIRSSEEEKHRKEDVVNEDDHLGILDGKYHNSLVPKAVTRAQKVASKSGVLYISRVPPFMKPQTLRHFLAPHAPKGLGRIFLTPEDHVAHTRRVRNGGNKKKSFTDGWVEFVSKREAKLVAGKLNGNIMGGNKGNFYHDDLWTLKYLKGFKWSHLSEQIANENAERAARMREEIRKTRVENKTFVQNFERGKMLETIDTKKKARLRANGISMVTNEILEESEKNKDKDRMRDIKQKTVYDKDRRAGMAGQSDELQKVLSKIF